MPRGMFKSKGEPGPSRINGPAFFVFGIMFFLLGLGTEMKILVWPGLAILLIGVYGIYLQRRYEKAAGIEETLPGKSPERPQRPQRPEPPEQVEPAEQVERPESHESNR